MKIAVIGAGIVGITTAYELALDGHQISVFDANSAVAEAASFATGPMLSPSLISPLTHSPWPMGSHLKQWLTADHIQYQRGFGMADAQWRLRRKSQNLEAFEPVFAAQHALVKYSIAHLSAICHDEGLNIERGDGQMVLLETEKQLEVLQPQLDWLKAHGTAWKRLSAVEIQPLEPALFHEAESAIALYFPEDCFGNCRQFVQLLKDRAQALGVRFEFGSQVTGFSSAVGVEVHASNQATPEVFDHVVLCTGALTGKALQMLGKRIPLAQIQSYSLSAAIREPMNAPRNAVFDMATRNSIVRLGSRVRVSGGAELGPGSTKNNAATIKSLYQSMQKHFPGAIHQQTGTQLWKGSSIFSADHAPLIGPSTTDRFWLNTAHGYSGWGMSCGSARLLADLMKGTAPGIDPLPFSPSRFNA